MTLETGDVILTGTPAGSSVVVPGDVVEVEVDAPGCRGRAELRPPRDDDHRGRRTPSATTARSPRSTTCQRIEAWGASRSRRLSRRPRRRRGATPDAAPRPRSSSPTSCASCSAPSASRPSASQLRKRGYTTSSSRACTPTARAPASSAGPDPAVRPVPPRPVRAHGGGYNAQKLAFDTVGPGEVLVDRGPRRARHRHGRRRARAARPGARRGRHRHRRRHPRLRRGRRARHPHVLAGPAPLGARPPARAMGGRRRDRVRRRGRRSPATSSWATATASS